MTKLLVRLFIRTPDGTDEKTRFAYGKLAGGTGIACNVLLFFIKLAAGLLASSVAIIADAFNNLSDAGSSIVTLFAAMGIVSGVKKRSRPEWLTN